MKLTPLLVAAVCVWFAAAPADAGYNDDPFSLDPNAVPTTPGGFSGSGRSVAGEREVAAPIYTAAEIRLLKARLKQLEEKVARGERALSRIRREGIKCHEHHFKNSLSASSLRRSPIGARKSGNWPASAGRKSLIRPQHSMRCGAAARHPCKRFIWWR